MKFKEKCGKKYVFLYEKLNFGAIFSKKDVRDYKIKVAGASNVELPETYECKNMPEVRKRALFLFQDLGGFLISS